MVSAEKFFGNLSGSFGAIKDYECAVKIVQGKTEWRGKLSYKSPLFLRIDFDEPKGQVFVINAEKLTIFVPQYEVVLEQKYKKKGPAAIASLASIQGLAMLQKDYSVGFLVGPEPVPLEEGSREQVVKLKLMPHATTGFRQLVLSVKESLVRRVEGIQESGEKIVLDLANVRINQGVPDSRFQYDPPAYANVIPDFLFDPEE
jgi:outer membrane lipoprotein-sorting protein